MSFSVAFGALLLTMAVAVSATVSPTDTATPANRNLDSNQTSTWKSVSTEATTTITAAAKVAATENDQPPSTMDSFDVRTTTEFVQDISTKGEKSAVEPSTLAHSDAKDDSTSVSDDMVTIDTGTIAFSDDENAASSEHPESETVSFGIRSFTVEVSTATTEKPTVDQHRDDASVVMTQQNEETISPMATAGIESNNDSNETGTTNSGITIVPIKLTAVDTFSALPSSPSPPLPTSTSTKQENGLYRIKIAEIITDEFNSGMRDHDADADDGNDENMNEIQNQLPPAILMNRFRAQQAAAEASQKGKINIDDLYPSKIEDFEPIIRKSNEKMLQQKNQFVLNSDDDVHHFDDDANADVSARDDGNRQQNSIQMNYGVDSSAADAKIDGKVNFIENNIPTTKIEIELIDEPGASKDDIKIIGPSDDDDDVEQDVEISSIDASVVGPDDSDGDGDDKVTDFTSKLQENDGIISTIERSFLKVANNGNANANENDKQPITVNKALNAMGFIERRVKKHDPTFRSRFALNEETGKARSDIGNTKFNGDTISIADNTIAPTDNRKTEFSTTKFFNNRNEQSNPASTATKPSKAATATDAKAKDQKILFFNVNGNRSNAKEMERMKHDREEIIKGRTMRSNESAASTESLNMHLHIIHDNAVTSPATANKANEKPSSVATTAMPMAAVSSKTVINSAPSTSSAAPSMSVPISTANAISATEQNNSPSPPSSSSSPSSASTAWASMPNAETEAALMRSQQLKRLRDRINSLECDMQTALPDESSVWRGNETHELSLPTTVSSNIVSYSIFIRL